MRSKSAFRWIILTLAWLIYFSFGLIFGALAPLVTPIMEDLHMSYSEMGVVSGAWQLVYVFAAQPLGLFVDRQGSSWTLFLGLIIIALSSILRGFATNFPSLLLFVALFGIGGVLISTGLPKLIASWFTGKERGFATGINTTAPSSGIMVAMSITNSHVLPTVGSWENAFRIYGFVALIVAALWLVTGRAISNHSSSEGITDALSVPKRDSMLSLLRYRNVQLIAVIGIASFLLGHSLSSWLPKIFELKGMTPIEAGTQASLYSLAGIAGSLTLPRLSYRWRSRRNVLSVILLLFGASCLMIGLGRGVVMWGGLLLAGVSGKALMPILLITLMDMPEIGSRYMGTASGMFFAVGEIGGFSGPFLMGYLKDLTGSFLIGIVFLFVFSEMMILAAVSLRIDASRRRSDVV